MNASKIILSCAVIAALCACSSRQIYNAGAGWRQNECQKILEGAERARCLESAGKDYDTYSRERDGAAGQK